MNFRLAKIRLVNSKFQKKMQKTDFCPMFTGIIEATAIIKEVRSSGTNKIFQLESDLAPSLKIDQSLCHDGVCLTVEAIQGNTYQVTAVAETLEKTNLHSWQPGRLVNLERSLQVNSRLDGHFVQGHVDTTAVCTSIINKEGSYEMLFEFPSSFAPLVIEKGSICINGISLTAWDTGKNSLKVAVIPYTWQHTNLHQLSEGQAVNFEFDMIGKYIIRKMNL